MTGTVTINGVTYQVVIPDLTPADVLPVFRTDTSILKTDSILLHAAGAQQNSAKKVLIPHLISAMASSVAEDVALTIEPYYDASGEYQGMYWHMNSGWLRRTDTGEMIRVDDEAAAAALAADQANSAAAGAVNADSRATNNENARVQAEVLRVQQATSDHTRAEGDHTTATSDHTQAGQDHTRAEGDHDNALTATAGAEQVNAQLSGMTVTITNRQGQASSVNIGFEIYRTYTSVAAMNADAANVMPGKFVMIATADATSEENARLYGKNSQGGFTFLSDLDQASSAAWADWLENMKPAINQRISTADSDHQTATSDHTTAQGDHTTAVGDHTQAGTDHTRAEGDHTTAAGDHTQAGQDHTRAEGDHTTAAGDHTQAGQDHTRAEGDHEAAQTATQEAGNVNAQLSGMTVTITNRQGVASSVNIGFEIYQTYASVAAMNADAANVPTGKFVMIATSDATSEENARLYGKNSQGGFTFLSDLDQASSAAWADWLENMKPAINQRISTADADHQTATSDHTRAATDHTRADDDHTQAGSDHTRAETDHTTSTGDHTQAGQDHTRAETDHTQAGDDHTTATGDHTQAGQDHTRAETDHTRAEGDHTTATGDHTQAGQDHTRAEDDHEAAQTATQEAGNVNAQLSGMTVTITNRQGVASSVNIGFEIYNTYTSVAAMNADAANVPTGKFVMIATSDATSEENARLYGKNSQGGFTFLSDLDQASSAAWADWLENMKPAINQRISTADADHQTATSDHTRAADDHTQAGTDHTRAADDHTQAGTDHIRAESMHAHQPYIADGTAGYPGDAGYFYSWDYTLQQYVRGPKLSLDYSSMTQAERDALAQDVLATISFDSTPTENSQNAVTSGGVYAMKVTLEHSVSNKQDALTFASVATCESIIDELTQTAASG